MMMSTAEANEVPWRRCVDWISQQAEWSVEEKEVPEYYASSFHAYREGNLCFEAAFEQEIASAAVGARNYPKFGRDGEEAFRGAFDVAFDALGATVVPDNGVLVDLGCGTGTSTRRFAQKYPRASKIVGMDLSPYMLAVGRRLLELAPTRDVWVTDIEKDDRISFVHGDAASLPFPDGSIDVCALNLVVHECPPSATRAILSECRRVLHQGHGQLWIAEMDFDTPGFKNLRSNPLLFSFIRSTEPMLDLYADYNAMGIAQDLRDLGFDVRLQAATGRHFALVATVGGQGTIDDRRTETALPDTHLATWAVADSSSSSSSGE